MKYEEYIDLILLANYYYVSCQQTDAESNKTKYAKEYLDSRIKSALKQVTKNKIKSQI